MEPNTFYSLTGRAHLDTVGSESFSSGILVEQDFSYHNIQLYKEIISIYDYEEKVSI